jgi:hypothetical protein
VVLFHHFEFHVWILLLDFKVNDFNFTSSLIIELCKLCITNTHIICILSIYTHSTKIVIVITPKMGHLSKKATYSILVLAQPTKQWIEHHNNSLKYLWRLETIHWNRSWKGLHIHYVQISLTQLNYHLRAQNHIQRSPSPSKQTLINLGQL